MSTYRSEEDLWYEDFPGAICFFQNPATGFTGYLIHGDLDDDNLVEGYWKHTYPDLYRWAKDPSARVATVEGGIWLKAPWIDIVKDAT